MLAGLLLTATVSMGLALGSAPPSTDPGATVAVVAVAPVDSTSSASASAASINEFIPDDMDLSECISALPRPECASKARGGWRQTLLLGVLVAGLGVIGWRIVVAVRRGDRSRNQGGS